MNDAVKVNSIEYYGADNLGMSELELRYISELQVWHIHKGIYKAIKKVHFQDAMSKKSKTTLLESIESSKKTLTRICRKG